MLTLPKWFDRSYIIEVVCLFFLTAPLAIWSTYAAPIADRSWFPNQESISYPTRTSMVPESLLILIAWVIPALVIVLIQFLHYHTWNKSKERFLAHWTEKLDLIVAQIGLYASISITMIITFVIKQLAGQLRPDFLDRCKPVNGKCTGNEHDIIEGRKTFPSGHSSFAASGCVFLALYFAGKYRLFVLRSSNNTFEPPRVISSNFVPNSTLNDPESLQPDNSMDLSSQAIKEKIVDLHSQLPLHSFNFVANTVFPPSDAPVSYQGKNWDFLKEDMYFRSQRYKRLKFCLFLAPLLVAIFVACTRILDNHHRPRDVLVGHIIGYFVTYFCYSTYFGSLFRLDESGSIRFQLNPNLVN